jgi:hypothetical protein
MSTSKQIQGSARRSGSSPDAAGYDAASKVEAQLSGEASKVGAHVLPSSEAPARVRVNVHGLPLCHARHGNLLAHAGESLRLQDTSVSRAACEPGLTAQSKGGPVRTQLRSSVDSCGDGYGLPCVLRGGRAE